MINLKYAMMYRVANMTQELYDSVEANFTDPAIYYARRFVDKNSPLYSYNKVREHISRQLRGEIPTVHS